ncbi:MAG: S-layer homology domain-containing protein [Clostridiales bacterium]|jgi:alpha-tubulin suppressor-like RCC1 family protein|nr:S-layer homology domain-containing protein [Clostridiales bacterium]
MKKFVTGITKRFFAIILAFLLIFSAMPVIPVSANVNVRPGHNVLDAHNSGTIVIRNDGSLWAWGNVQDGRSPTGTIRSAEPIRILEGIYGVQSVFAGVNEHWAIMEDNTLWAWGGRDGAMPLGDGARRGHPTPIRILDNVASMPALGYVIRTDGSLWTWFSFVSAAMLPQFADRRDLTYDPQWLSPHHLMDNVLTVARGGNVTAIIRSDGALYTFGDNEYGQLGDGTRTNRRDAPVRVMDNVVEVHTNGQNTMALQSDGSLWTWGLGGNGGTWGTDVGLTGDGSVADRLRPVKIMDNVITASMGGDMSWSSAFAVQSDGTLWGWGVVHDTGLGVGEGRVNVQTTPVRIMDSVSLVSAGRTHTHVVRNDGSLWGFGWSDSLWPRIGDGTMNDAPLPVMIWGPGSVLGTAPPVVPPTPTPTPPPTPTPTPPPTPTPTPPTTPPTTPRPPISAPPSAWAQEGVGRAISLWLVPQSLQSDYTQAITRAEFAALAVSLYERVMWEIGGRVAFTDTLDENVQKAAYLGIVTGVGGGRFDPDAPLTREQAAVMLSRLANAIFQPLAMQPPTFADNAAISSWAVEAVGQVQSGGIMGDTGNNQFSPQGIYTREQSIITILRIFDLTRN